MFISRRKVITQIDDRGLKNHKLHTQISDEAPGFW